MKRLAMTKVIFRKVKRTNEIIALFPTLPANNAWYSHCLCYRFGSGFNAGDINIAAYSIAAQKKEAAPLISHLTKMGYCVEIALRFRAEHLSARKAAVEVFKYAQT